MLNLLAIQMSPEAYNVFVVLAAVAMGLMFVAALGAIILVLLQQSNSDGIQGITGSSETFFGKNKGQSIESKLKKWTWITLAVLAVLSIIFYVVMIILSNAA